MPRQRRVRQRTGLSLFPPVVGRFDGGRGEFNGDGTHEGRVVRVRFVWSGVSPGGARGERAFVVDGRETWATNWTTDFSRPPVS